MLIIKGNETTLLPIKDKFGIENILNKVPDLMEKVQKKHEEMKTEEK